MITTVSKLKVGQRFSFIPPEWYGQCRLTIKSPRTDRLFDIKFDANVVNPPGVIYGISGETKVRLLSDKPRLQTKGSNAGYRV